MEASSCEAEGGRKRRKTCFCDADRLSALPDPILHHILGLIGARQAAKMCILSKRWKNVWASTPSLCFDDQDFRSTFGKEKRIQAYTKFVESELRRHDKSNMVLFHFAWRYGYVPDIVVHWMHNVIESSARELNLYIHKHPPHDEKLLELVSLCTRLQVLRLDVPTHTPPLLTGFDKLKTLILSSVESPRDSFGEQLGGCLALQELSLYSCSFKSIQIPSARLESFTLHESTVSDHDIVVSAPHLRSFEYSTRHDLDTFSFDVTSPLAIARIGIHRRCKDGDKISSILRDLCNVKKLTFTAFNLQCKRNNKDGFLRFLPIFKNLKHLEMIEVPANAMKAVKEILQRAPNLENLRITSKKRKRKKSTQTQQRLKHFKRLRTLEIHGFEGSNAGAGLVNYIERNAGVVKKRKASLAFDA